MIRPDRPMQENLPWLFPITEGVVACKDSGLLASFSFEGVDANATSQDEIAAMIQRLDSALKIISEKKISIWWTVHRRRTTEYPSSPKWSNELAQEIDEVNRESFLSDTNFVNRHYVSLVMYPSQGTSRYFDRVSGYITDGMNPLAAAAKAMGSLITKDGSFAWSADQLESALSNYEIVLDTFAASLLTFGLNRLYGEDFYGFLAACASPDWHGGPAKIHKRNRMDWFMDGLLSNHDISVGNDTLRIDGGPQTRYASAISIKEWPEYTEAGALDVMLALPYELTVSHVFRFAGKAETEKQADANKRFNDLLKHSVKSWVIGAFNSGATLTGGNPARVAASEECNEITGLVTSGDLAFGWQNTTIVMYADSEAGAKSGADMAYRAFASMGYPGAVRETLHMLSAWSTTIPGQWRDCRRWALLSTENIEDVAPLRTILRGEVQNRYLSEQTGRYCPALTVLRTDYATPFYFNFHHGALGHTMVLGPSRSGKSVFMNFLISQWQKYTPCRTIIFDKDYSCKIATLLQGGMHIDLSDSAEEIKINPMALASDSNHWPFLVRWIDGLLSSKGYQTNAEDERAIREAIEEVAADHDPAHYRLWTIYTLLPDRLKTQLEPWVEGGQMSKYFDNTEDTFSLADFSCIEMGFILRDPRVARAFMDYAFYRIQGMMESNRRGDVIPTFIYLEECWFLLEDPFFAERIRDWLKTMAKMTCHVVMATQSLEDIASADTKVFSSMRDNIMTNIFLPNYKARTESLKKLYSREFEVSDEQINVIAEARPQEQYLIMKPNAARLVSCKFTPEQLAVFRSDAKAQGIFQRHFEGKKPGWQKNYIDEVVNAK